MELGSLGIAVLSAVVYSLSMYVKKHLNPNSPQSFDVAKFITTLIWGVIIGILLQAFGVPVTEQAVEEQFVAYAGIIAITENIVKTIIRVIRR